MVYERFLEDMVGVLVEVFENFVDKIIFWRIMVFFLGDVCLLLSKLGIWEFT